MINNNDINISNKSYTNKDFQTIYPELLELAQKLSTRWNPAQSNESDPGVVLLKLLAFIGDKTNYNIDKNILEAFMPSATQETSMRNLCEMNGYNMRYYQSATTNVAFTYTDVLESGEVINLKAFETTLTNSDNELSFVLLKDINIQSRNKTEIGSAIQGVLRQLSINGETSIQLSNLDDNYRLYFPERNVAENGVFISNVNLENRWEQTTNLNFHTLEERVYRFGFDSVQSLPYVEFTSNISSLIDSGLSIKYIVTDGVNGNVSSNTLNTLSNTSTLTIVNGTSSRDVSLDNLVIKNIDSSTNGVDSETLDEAYTNYKRVIGTFNTLVTCRDYTNAIYNFVDSDTNSKNIVGNVQVTDRRSDINNSDEIITFDENGVHKITQTNDLMTPYDLGVYALEPLTKPFNIFTYIDTYNGSFKPISKSGRAYIESLLEDEKLISHNYKSIANNDIYAYKNYLSLDAQISTNSKVDSYERQNILSNVKRELFEKFNSRKVEFGYEIPFDALLDTIQDADARIRNVSLAEPKVNTKVLLGNGEEIDYLTKTPDNEKYKNITPYVELLAKNVLAGKVSLFDFDNSLKLEFGQSQSSNSGCVFNDLESLTTEVVIPKEELSKTSGYTLRSNEIIQFIAPNLSTELIYPSYVNYNLSSDEEVVINANQDYEITGTTVFTVNYTDSNDTEITVEYTKDKIITNNIVKELVGESNIIRPSFTMTLTTSQSGTPTKVIDGKNFFSLGTNDQVEIRKPVKDIISSSLFPCYWVMNNSTNTLFSEDRYKNIVLQQGEYFIYTNAVEGGTSLTVLGSGTRLSLENKPSSNWTCNATISSEEISESGLSAFQTDSWVVKNLSSNNLTIEEMKIITLSENDNVKINGTLGNNINNTPQSVYGSFIYTINGESTLVEPIEIFDVCWNVYSRLDINSGPVLPQEIKDNQSFTITNGAGTHTITKDSENKNTYITFSTLIQSLGGENMNIRTIDLDGNVLPTIDAFVYCQDDITYNKVVLERDGNGYINVSCKNFIENTPLVLPLISDIDGRNILLTIYNDVKDEKPLTITLNSFNGETANSGLRHYNSGGVFSGSITINKGLNTIEIANETTELRVLTDRINTSSQNAIRIGKLTLISGLNSYFNLSGDNTKDDLLKEIKDKSNGKYFYLYDVNNENVINSYDLSDARALWDINNKGNRFTISQIDFEKSNSTVDIVKSSRL